MAHHIDKDQQERLHRIMNLPTNAVNPIVPEEPAGSASQNMIAKKRAIHPMLIIFVAIIFLAIYAFFWAYYFKLLKF